MRARDFDCGVVIEIEEVPTGGGSVTVRFFGRAEVMVSEDQYLCCSRRVDIVRFAGGYSFAARVWIEVIYFVTEIAITGCSANH